MEKKDKKKFQEKETYRKDKERQRVIEKER